MTQYTFAFAEVVTATNLNKVVQGYRFLKRVTFTGCNALINYAKDPRATALYAIVFGPGGGGAGAALCPAFSSAGAGGGAGGYSESLVTSASILSSVLQVLAPTGGLGGIAGTFNGLAASSGAAITYIDTLGQIAVILGASPGAGGSFMPIAAAPGASRGGLPGAGYFGDLNMAGEAGGLGLRLSPTTVLSGRGGNSPCGGGAGDSFAHQPGAKASSYGAGGSGGGSAAGGLAQTGGDGGDALIIIDEYY